MQHRAGRGGGIGRAVVEAGRILARIRHVELAAPSDAVLVAAERQRLLGEAGEAVFLDLVGVLADIGADDARRAPGIGRIRLLEILPVEDRLRPVGEAAGRRRVIVIGERDALARAVLAGRVVARPIVAGQRLARHRVGRRIGLEGLARQREGVHVVDAVRQLAEDAVVLEILWIGLGAGRAVAAGVAVGLRLVARHIGALHEDRRVVDLAGDGVRGREGVVGARIDVLGDEAPLLAFGDDVIGRKRGEGDEAAHGARADDARIGAAHDVDRRQGVEIEGRQAAGDAARIGGAEPGQADAVDRGEDVVLAEAADIDAVVLAREVDARLGALTKALPGLDHPVGKLLPRRGRDERGALLRGHGGARIADAGA